MAALRAGAAAHPVMAARPVVHSTARTSTRIRSAPKPVTHPVGWNGNHGTHNRIPPVNAVFPDDSSFDDGFPVPGNGFDYTHYFAVHPNAGKCHRCRGNGGLVLPFVDGGVYIPTAMYAEQPTEAQPAEEAAPAEQAAQPEQAPQETYSNPPARMAPQSAPKPQAEYVFVRRDGTLIFAVAYSWINDRLQYVTSEGLRRTVSLDTIDLGATQQFNEQRGIPIQLPA